MMKRWLRAAVAFVAACGAQQMLVPAPASAATNGYVLFLQDSLAYGDDTSPEVIAAQNAGFDIDIVDATTWSSLTHADFASYEAIAFGQSCGGLSTQLSNAATWVPAVTGNVSIYGGDPIWHGHGGAGSVVETMMRHATSAGTTGLYAIRPGCVSGSQQLFDAIFGAGQIRVSSVCTGAVAIVEPGHPIMNGLNGSDFAYGCSAHEAYTRWPAQLTAVVVDNDSLPGAATILARGGTIAPVDLASTPDVAAGPTGVSLVVWTQGDSNNNDIWAARVQNGTVLNRTRLTTAPGNQLEPAAAWDVTTQQWLVVWQDARTGVNDIRGRRLTPSGSLSGTEILVSGATGQQFTPDVAASAGKFYVAWHDGRSAPNYDIYGTVINSNGSVVTPAGKALSTAAGNQGSVAVAPGPSGTWFAVWHDKRSSSSLDIYGTRISTVGAPVSPAGTVISNQPGKQVVPALAFSGSNYLVVWCDDRRATEEFDLFGTRVSTSGVVQSAAGFQINGAADDQCDPGAEWNGASFEVIWSTFENGGHFDVRGTRVPTSSGGPLSASGQVITGSVGDQNRPALARVGGEWFAAWTDTRNGSDDVYGTGITPSGTSRLPSGTKINVN